MEKLPRYVPKINRAFDTLNFNRIKQGLNSASKITVITGAGCSTESGIPDYRSPGVGVYAREENYKPILGHELANSYSKRQRYWARNFIGYPAFASKQPTTVHKWLKNWENGQLDTLEPSKLMHLITQNVDGLHVQAGHKNITELHGNTHRTNCLDCGEQVDRMSLQHKFESLNPKFLEGTGFDSIKEAPDADAVIDDQSLVEKFKMANCKSCGSDRLKPDVVFFGDNVPRNTVDLCYDMVDESDCLLVLGSTLEVYSSFRFARRASEKNTPIYIVNIGPTRADKLKTAQLECQLADFCARFN